ncbi:hypothetical protein [Sporomusa sphaeroides]|uniref:nucleotide-binding protein n=1 Tax=Sporomusa sphaeroides TaxID=47679 RepID=UPI003157F835
MEDRSDKSIFYNSGPKVKIFLGEYGSGKTELAINYAVKIKKLGYKTALVDMDIAKPYFHSREHRALLEQRGVEVIAADQRLTNAELPVLPQDLNKVFCQKDYRVVMDVGGGDSAIVLGQFFEKIADSPYQAILVINALRPFTSTIEGVVEVYQRIENACGLKISSLISNTNLGNDTAHHHIQQGIELTEAVSKRLRLPIHSVVVPECLWRWQGNKIRTEHNIFLLHPYTQYPWQTGPTV